MDIPPMVSLSDKLRASSALGEKPMTENPPPLR
jgi:hypothetical protein